MHQIFKVGKYKGKIKFEKIWGYQNGGPSQMGPKKFINHLCQTHEIFIVGKYYKKIKFDKIWGYRNVWFSVKRGHHNFELLNH